MRTGRGARTWALTRMAFRELVPVQGVIQALGVVVVTGLLAAQASGLIAGLLTLGGEPVGVFSLSAYGLTAFVVALYASFTHGIVMAARTPALLRAGLTRGAVMTWLTCTGLLLGAASTAVCGLLTIPEWCSTVGSKGLTSSSSRRLLRWPRRRLRCPTSWAPASLCSSSVGPGGWV